jgi:hypothetical protein
MPTYELIKDYGGDKEVVTSNPFWLLGFIRYAQPVTSSRAIMAEAFNNQKDSHNQASNYTANADNSTLGAVKSMLVVRHDCTSLSITSNKSNHVASLQAVLRNSGTEYLSELMPGDWMFAWIVNDEKKYESLYNRILSLSRANHFDDGLKFVGRVHDIRKAIIQSPQGPRTIQYNLTGQGFGELDSTVFFDPLLTMHDMGVGDFLARLDIAFASVYEQAASEVSSGRGGLRPSKAIPALLNALVGRGIDSSKFGRNEGLQPVNGLTAEAEAPFAYCVPEGVGRLLGVRRKSKTHGLYSYADVLDTFIGKQKYSDNSGNNSPRALLPDGISNTSRELVESDDSKDVNRHYTGHPLEGEYFPTAIQFSQKTVWTILNEFLNSSVNEMYTSLRWTPRGGVFPTLVARQKPFSSPVFTNRLDASGIVTTGFAEVPRWKVSSVLIRGMDVGRSEGDRLNFFHIYGVDPAPTSDNMRDQILRCPPLKDSQDIKRNGLRPYMNTANCSFEDTNSGPAHWMALNADFLSGLNLTLNGTMVLAGVTSPISAGDNLEFDGIIYHIESVKHDCLIEPTGRKTFTTHVTLTHGVEAHPASTADKHLFPGVGLKDLGDYTPGRTDEHRGTDQPPTVDSPIVSKTNKNAPVNKNTKRRR